MSTDALDSRSLGFADDFVQPSEELNATRLQAAELGVEPLSAGSAALLRFLATSVQARAVVEIGTGSGTSGLAMFEGMDPDGVLTSVDTEADRQGAARQSFLAAGIRASRVRLINGVPLEVLPKLRTGAYDLVFINGDKLEYVEYVDQALRLLRHGGVMVLNDVLWRGAVADLDNQDDEAVIIREALESVQQTEEWTPVMVPLGTGMLAAIKA